MATGLFFLMMFDIFQWYCSQLFNDVQWNLLLMDRKSRMRRHLTLVPLFLKIFQQFQVRVFTQLEIDQRSKFINQQKRLSSLIFKCLHQIAQSLTQFLWSFQHLRLSKLGGGKPDLHLTTELKAAREWDLCSHAMPWLADHVAKTMPFLPPIFLGMVNIPPIKMVITEGWCLIVLPTYFATEFIKSRCFCWGNKLLSYWPIYLPLWKIWKSVGMILPNIWKVIKFHGSKKLQTTNQI